jgi:hypothetical protein
MLIEICKMIKQIRWNKFLEQQNYQRSPIKKEVTSIVNVPIKEIEFRV